MQVKLYGSAIRGAKIRQDEARKLREAKGVDAVFAIDFLGSCIRQLEQLKSEISWHD